MNIKMNYDTKRSSQSTVEQGLGDKAKYIFQMKTIDIMCKTKMCLMRQAFVV